MAGRGHKEDIAVANGENLEQDAHFAPVSPGPDLGAVRRRLNEAFDDAELDAFCLDHFPDVYDKFSRGMRKDEKITLLLDRVRRNRDWHPLLAALQAQEVRGKARISGLTPPSPAPVTHLWRWLAERLVYYTPLRRRYLRAYCGNLAADFRTLNLLGRSTPLDLEKIYIVLRMSRHARPDLLPDLGRADLGPQGEDLRRARRREKAMEVEAALGLSARLVILGDPGAGKTTLLKHLALRAARGDPRLAAVMPKTNRQESADAAHIPIFVTLNDLARDGQGLVDGLTDALERRGFLHARLFVERALAQGRCLCLLDGLDEVVNDQDHERLVREIDALAVAYPGNLLLVTSRIAGYRYLLQRDFTLLEVTEFDREQIRCFVETWFAAQPQRAEGLLAALADSPGMRLLAANPLLLSIIAWIYELDTRLPERRVELYDRCVWVLLEAWERLKGLVGGREFPPDPTRRALAALALCFQQRQRVALDRDQLLAHLAHILPEADRAEAFLDEVLARTGLLRQMSRTSYAFTHLTVQEFLAAEAVHQAGDHTLALKHVDDPWWRETIVLLAGLERDATSLIREILAAWPGSLEALLLAVRCLADADETEPALRIEVVGRMVAWLKTAGDCRLVQGVEDLADALGEAAWAELIGLLGDPDPAVRARIAGLLGAIGAERAVTPLLEAALRDEAAGVRAAAGDALGVIGGTRATDLLVEIFRDRANELRLRAAEALFRAEEHVARPLLLSVLQDSSEPAPLRIAMAEAIGAISLDAFDAAVCQALTALLSGDDEQVRCSASEALRFAFLPVSAGEFTMGEDQGKFDDEKPAHPVYVESLYMARYPVTEAQYHRFVAAIGYNVPKHWQGGRPPEGKEGHPVVNVSWHDAVAYCQWLAGNMGRLVRLPTEAEWEKAAIWDEERERGGEGGRKRKYPWGDEFDKSRCNTDESGNKGATLVSNYSPQGDSPYGCADMAGNVWEWTSSLYKSYPYRADDGREDAVASGTRVLRGGSWDDDQDSAQCSFRFHNAPSFRANYYGFRVCIAMR